MEYITEKMDTLIGVVQFIILTQLNKETPEKPSLCCFILKNLSNSGWFSNIVDAKNYYNFGS
jgi:hypothetical protein